MVDLLAAGGEAGEQNTVTLPDREEERPDDLPPHSTVGGVMPGERSALRLNSHAATPITSTRDTDATERADAKGWDR